MIEPVVSVARKLLRDGRNNRSTTRFWAGWRMELTYGPADLAFGPERHAAAMEAAREIYAQAFGRPPPDDPQAEATAREAQHDLWHLSASWRGNHPAEDGRRLLAELIVALGVPEAEREGHQLARTMVAGRASPQVTHWIWRNQKP